MCSLFGMIVVVMVIYVFTMIIVVIFITDIMTDSSD